MNIRDLRYFVAVAEHEHFGKAAAACFVSQPTLSAQLKKLEETLGVILFERNNKTVMLTAIGRQCLQVAKAALLQVEELQKLARQSQDPLAGELRLGVIPTIAPYLLPKIVPKLIKPLPKLTLLLEEVQTEPLLKKLEQGELDAGIIALPVPKMTMQAYSLFKETFVLALPVTHELARHKQVAMKGLRDQNLLLLEEGHCLRDQTLSFCQNSKVQERQDFRATSLETLRQMVVAGVGVTVMPAMAAYETPGVTYRPFAEPQPQREIVLVARPGFSRHSLIVKIHTLLREG